MLVKVDEELTDQLTYFMSRVILEKLKVSKLVKKFSTFCGTQRFIAMLTRARNHFLSSATWIQTTPWFLKINFNITSYLYLGLQSVSFPFRFFLRNFINISHLPLHNKKKQFLYLSALCPISSSFLLKPMG